MPSDNMPRNPERHLVPRVAAGAGLPASVLAAVQALLGFQPAAGDLVVIGALAGTASAPGLTLRYDLPDDERMARSTARHAASVLSGNGITRALVIGYGPQQLVGASAGALLTAPPR